MARENLQILLRRRPQGAPTPDDFETRRAPVPEPGDGEVLIRHQFLSLDPYMRGRMSDAKSYAKPVEVGAVMEGRACGVVEASRHPRFRPGECVFGGYGWQRYSAVDGRALMRLDPAQAPVSTSLGVLGMPGLTAYVGMQSIGRPKPGETVVVSAASGAVGSVVGQIAKQAGARAVGIAGGPEKCAFVVDELGFDACLDHRAPGGANSDGGSGSGLEAALDRVCPDGVDVYFENVGGTVQRAVFPRLRDFARVVMCGMVAEYNDTERRPGPNLMDAVRKRLHIQGFIVSDHFDRMAEWRALAAPWLREGKLRYRETVVDGLERAPEAFIGLLQGRNFGKLVVRVGD